MKIKSIYLKNINSLKGEHYVDFEDKPLVDANIMLISGATGAGKTTLLDAITLGLYNQTPRTSKASKSLLSSSGAIMTRGTKESIVAIEYHVNSLLYLSKWSIKINKNGNLNDYHMELTCLSEGDSPMDLKKSEVPNKNSEIIGLNYDQFIKSILLSQGEFAKLLKASAEERSALLEKITGTEIYRQIGKEVFLKWREEQQALDRIENKKGDIEILDTEVRKEINEDLKLKEFNLESIEKVIEELINSIKLKEAFIKNEQLLVSKEKELSILNAESNKFSEKEKEIAKYESFIPFFERFNELKANDKSISDFDLKIKEDNSSLIDKDKLLARKKEEFNLLDKAYKDLKNTLVTEKKLWDNVSEIDKNIEIKKVELEPLKSRRKVFLDTTTSSKKNVTELNTLINNLKEELNKANVFIADNKLIKENEESISKLNYLFEDLKSNEAKLDNTIDRESYTIQFQNYNSKIEELKSNIHLKDKEFKGLTLESVYRDRDAKREEYSTLDKAHKLSEVFLKSKAQLYNLKLQVESLFKEKTNLVSEKEVLLQKQAISQAKLKELRAKQERQLLEAKYEQDRSKLVENEACFLCGSKNHPYVNSYVNSLDNTKEALEKETQSHEDLTQKINGITTKLEKGKVLIEETNKKKKELEEIITSGLNEFKALNLLFEIESSKQISDEITKVKELGVKLNSNIKELELLESTKKELANTLKAFELIGALNKIYSEIKSILTLFNPNTKDIDKEIKALNTKKAELETITRKSRDFENELNLKTTELQNFKNKLNEVEEELRFLNTQIDTLTKDYNTLINSRLSLFGHKVLEVEKETFAIKLESKQNNSQNVSKTIHALEGEITLIAKSLGDLVDKRKVVLETQLSLKSNLETDLEKNNLKYTEFSNLITQENHISYKKSIDEFKLGIEKLKQTIKDLKTSLEDSSKETTTVALEELQKSKIGEDSKRKNLSNEVQELKLKLREDDANKVRLKDILALIEKQRKQFRKWDLLKNTIGDSEGKKFSNFAQQLTFKRLIAMSNKYLQTLNGRYLLRKNNEDLEVVDTFQGDVSRSSSTLSGGESFLVSLALALGLSEMASRNVKIESLFIDEGFGTLDAETLDSAMETLEQLQYKTNRKVALISHVESIKERISTQIVLNKESSGFSTISFKA